MITESWKWYYYKKQRRGRNRVLRKWVQGRQEERTKPLLDGIQSMPLTFDCLNSTGGGKWNAGQAVASNLKATAVKLWPLSCPHNGVCSGKHHRD
ncbi:MAG: hypothetical protein CMN76_12385 [Spirochaetaceae bacterium]|nr:hypothetical protein [Spirochaetaceae bacterium]